MRFAILGEVAAWHADGSRVALGRPKIRALLSLLVLEAGQVVPTDRLAEGIYGDEPPVRTANALQAQVSRLRRQLGAGHELVEFYDHGYRLAVGPESTDVHEFETQIRQGQHALTSGAPAEAARLLGEALALWRGTPLANLADSPRVRARVAGLEETRLAAFESLAEADLARGELTTTVPRLRELVTAHPLRERLWVLLVRALAHAGRRAESLTAFEEARELLAEELGTDPSAELAATHLDILRAEHEPMQASRVRQPPTPLTGLVGRRDELRRLDALLAGERLVTLTGPGGAGKTRLAIEAARRIGLETCFVDLAAASEAVEVPITVATALGLRAHATSGKTSEQLANVLTQRPVLLLLDNCEHLADAVAALAAGLLAECGTARILATSREPLGITGEALWPVATLAVPPPGTEPDSALRYSAVSLFVERVAMGDPNFVLDASSSEHVRTICRALDGIPLAIELAAARIRTLPLAEAAARLDDPFTLLSRGDRTKDARHRTLRAVIDWSWGLLDAAERDMACRFSVFCGGATLDAVREVCGIADTEKLLSSLVDKSLLELRDGRYWMLETIRAYAVACLTEAGEASRCRRDHARYFLELAYDADPRLRGADQLYWLQRLDVAYPNLRAALRWAVDADTEIALRLTSALATYWWLRGRRNEGARLSSTVVAAVGTQPSESLAEEYLLAVFMAAADSAEPEPLRTHLDTVNRLTRRWAHSQAPPPAQPMLTLMWARLFGPAPEPGTALTAPSAELLDSDPWGHALHPLSDGLQQLHTGQADTAERSFRTALGRFRGIGERWGTMKTLMELARFASWRGEHDSAMRQLDEAIELSGQLEATEDTAEALSRRAEHRIRIDDLDLAREDSTRALELARETGVLEHLARARATVADIERLAGNLETADAAAQQALSECGSGWIRPSEARMRALLVVGKIAALEGRTTAALPCHLEVIADGNALTSASAIEGLAAIAVAMRNGTRAAGLLGAAAALRGRCLARDPDVRRTTKAALTLIGSDEFDAAYESAYESASGMSRMELLNRAAREWSASDQ